MDLSKILASLRQELENLDAAILSLERLQHEGRRRGRPPKVLAEMAARAASRKTGSEPAPASAPPAERE